MGMQNDILNDRIDVVTKGFLGLTVTCARCHDHKFDPIPQQDYYSLRGIFDSSVEPKVEPVIGKIHRTRRNTLPITASANNWPKTRKPFRPACRSSAKAVTAKASKRRKRNLRQTEHAISELEMTNPAAPMRAMVLEDPVRGHDSPLFIRGEAGNRGATGAAPFSAIVVRPGSARLYERQRAAGTGDGNCQPEQSAHRARDDQPHLAASFWRWASCPRRMISA